MCRCWHTVCPPATCIAGKRRAAFIEETLKILLIKRGVPDRFQRLAQRIRAK